jgi:hypothetical protein
MKYEEAVKLSRAFVRQRGFPQEPEGVAAFATDLLKVCNQNPDVDPNELAERWVDRSEFVPTRHELLALAAEMPRAGRSKPASESCRLCGGTGYRTVEKRGYEAVLPCSCVTEETTNGK